VLHSCCPMRPTILAEWAIDNSGYRRLTNNRSVMLSLKLAPYRVSSTSPPHVSSGSDTVGRRWLPIFTIQIKRSRHPQSLHPASSESHPRPTHRHNARASYRLVDSTLTSKPYTAG
jgi:hypothetical protein